MSGLPDILVRSERLLDLLEERARSGFHIAVESAESLGKAQAKAAALDIIANWVIAAALVVIAGILLFG
jgi:hypothetical protein